MATDGVTPRVLVTGAGGPSAISFINAVRGNDVELFAGDIDPYAAGLYLVAPERRWVLRRGDDPRFVDDVLAQCVAAHVDVIVPTVDWEMLPIARRRTEFADHGIALLMADEHTLMLCLDKWALLSACDGVCPLPRRALVGHDFDESEWPLPFVVKPRRGAGGRGVVLVHDLTDLASCPRDCSMIAQEYLPGNEYSVDVLSTPDATVVAVVPRARLKIDSGIAVTGRTVHHPRLEQLAGDVARHLGVTYVANVQFRDDAGGTPRLLEVNARFPGTMPLTVRSGVNMPCLALDMLLGRTISPGEMRFDEIGMVRTWQEHFVSVSEIAALELAARRRDES